MFTYSSSEEIESPPVKALTKTLVEKMYSSRMGSETSIFGGYLHLARFERNSVMQGRNYPGRLGG